MKEQRPSEAQEQPIYCKRCGQVAGAMVHIRSHFPGGGHAFDPPRQEPESGDAEALAMKAAQAVREEIDQRANYCAAKELLAPLISRALDLPALVQAQADLAAALEKLAMERRSRAEEVSVARSASELWENRARERAGRIKAAEQREAALKAQLRTSVEGGALLMEDPAQVKQERESELSALRGELEAERAALIATGDEGLSFAAKVADLESGLSALRGYGVSSWRDKAIALREALEKMLDLALKLHHENEEYTARGFDIDSDPDIVEARAALSATAATETPCDGSDAGLGCECGGLEGLHERDEWCPPAPSPPPASLAHHLTRAQRDRIVNGEAEDGDPEPPSVQAYTEWTTICQTCAHTETCHRGLEGECMSGRCPCRRFVTRFVPAQAQEPERCGAIYEPYNQRCEKEHGHLSSDGQYQNHRSTSALWVTPAPAPYERG